MFLKIILTLLVIVLITMTVMFYFWWKKIGPEIMNMFSQFKKMNSMMGGSNPTGPKVPPTLPNFDMLNKNMDKFNEIFNKLKK